MPSSVTLELKATDPNSVLELMEHLTDDSDQSVGISIIATLANASPKTVEVHKRRVVLVQPNAPIGELELISPSPNNRPILVSVQESDGVRLVAVLDDGVKTKMRLDPADAQAIYLAEGERNVVYAIRPAGMPGVVLARAPVAAVEEPIPVIGHEVAAASQPEAAQPEAASQPEMTPDPPPAAKAEPAADAPPAASETAG